MTRPTPALFAAAVLLSALALMLPTLWNGYPFTYYDTADYIVLPFEWHVPVYRTAAYGLFILTGKLVGSLWAPMVLQTIIVAYLLAETAHLLAPRRALVALAITMAALVLFTGLPWFTGQIMPDAFTGATVLAVFLLAFGDLRGLRRVLVIVALGLSAAMHTSHVAIAAGLLLCLLGARLMPWRFEAMPGPRLVPAAIGLVLSLLIAAGSNWYATGRVFLMQPNAILTLGLMVQNGLAKRYLDDVCPTATGDTRPKLCEAKDRLPKDANQFIWHSTDFWAAGGWPGLRPEALRIVRGILKRYPIAVMEFSAAYTARQFVMVETGDGVTPMRFFISKAIHRYYPNDVPDFLESRQQDGPDFQPSIAFDEINLVQVPAQLAATAALLPVLWVGWKRRDRLTVAIAAVALLALLGNAFVCGALSNPNHRYQSRIAWIAMIAAGFGALRLIAPQETRAASQSS
jgi:hypothetical protein